MVGFQAAWAGGNVHGPLPDWVTPMARCGADSTGASYWPPLSVRNLHHRDGNPSRCGIAPRARLAASIPGDRAHCPGGVAEERLRTLQYTVPQVGMPII